VSLNVGFVGLGRMGSGMARRILDAGHELTVYDAVAAATAPFGAAGARVATSLADLCGGRDVVVTMLVEDAAVLDVVLGVGGLRGSLPRRHPPGDGHARRGDDSHSRGCSRR